MDEIRKTAAKAFAEGKFDEAEKCFLHILEGNPRDEQLLNDLAVCCHFAGRLQDAEEYLLHAIAVNEDYLGARKNLAELYLNAKHWPEAAIHLEKCASIDTEDYNIQNRLGTVYLEMGDTQRAIRALGKSLEFEPDQEIVQESLQMLQTKDEEGSFRAAFIQMDITPSLSETAPVALQGYSGPTRFASDASTPLKMQILLLEDNHFTKLLIVTADLFGFGEEIVNHVRSVAARWGIEPEGILINASHTHYGPGTISHAGNSLGPFNAEYTKQVALAITEQLPLLYENLDECEISWGKTEAQIGVSRRRDQDGKIAFAPNAEGFYDRHTPFLLFHMKKNNMRVVMVNHGCHPVGLGDEGKISADFPAYMREALIGSGLTEGSMFLQGGGGSAKESVTFNNQVGFCDSSEGARANGEQLATEIIDCLAGTLQLVKGSFHSMRKPFSVPLKSLPQPEVIKEIKDSPEAIPMIKDWANRLINDFPDGDYPESLPMEIQWIALGEDLSIVTLPGEPVAELARDLRSISGHPDSTLVAGYTNGLIGYLPTDNMISEGGYETEFSHIAYLQPSAFDIGTESAILSAAKACSDTQNTKGNPDAKGAYPLKDRDGLAFFVLSAGRCGTMSLAHLLDTANNARVWHHPQPDPIKESLLAYWGDIDKREAFWKARSQVIQNTWSEGLIHGETDLLMTPFCDVLAKEIPGSKFLVLVRDPRDFVRSGMRRNYYYGHPWDFGRLKPREGSQELDEWNNLDQFEKICWLWNQTYETINGIVSQIEEDRVLILRFEDLIADTDKVGEIFKFLGLEGFDETRIEQILSTKFNAQPGGGFPSSENWSPEQRDRLWEICGPVAGTFGYSPAQILDPPVTPATIDVTTSPSVPLREKQPLLSVGLCVYNGEKYISEGIESVLSQDISNLELIISDNHSTDSTQEICERYQALDKRIRYVRLPENLGFLKNCWNALSLARAPYFMWATYDDLYESSFARSCIDRLETNPHIALVYSRTKMVNAESEFINIAKDHIQAAQDNPVERFTHLIWELGLCNAFLGVYRSDIIRKTRFLFYRLYRGYDNLFLAEVSLLGKIVQLEDILFIRRLTRDYTKTMEEQNAAGMEADDPPKIHDGITFPYCRLAYAHLELINYWVADQKDKGQLMEETIRCFRKKLGDPMVYEIDRAINLIAKDQYYYTWDRRTVDTSAANSEMLNYYYLNTLIKDLQEALFIYPEIHELALAYEKCLKMVEELRTGTMGKIVDLPALNQTSIAGVGG